MCYAKRNITYSYCTKHKSPPTAKLSNFCVCHNHIRFTSSPAATAAPVRPHPPWQWLGEHWLPSVRFFIASDFAIALSVSSWERNHLLMVFSMACSCELVSPPTDSFTAAVDIETMSVYQHYSNQRYSQCYGNKWMKVTIKVSWDTCRKQPKLSNQKSPAMPNTTWRYPQMPVYDPRCAAQLRFALSSRVIVARSTLRVACPTLPMVGSPTSCAWQHTWHSVYFNAQMQSHFINLAVSGLPAKKCRTIHTNYSEQHLHTTPNSPCPLAACSTSTDR